MRKIIVGILVSICLTLAVITIRLVFAQSSECPGFRTGPTFRPGETVYVDISVSIRGTAQEQQIIQALNDWTYANTHDNTSGITFNYTTNLNQIPPSASVLHVANQGLILDFTSGGPNAPDTTTFALFHVNGTDSSGAL